MRFLSDRLTPRLYQEKIFNRCVKKNCLVVLPTGLGKTIVALMLSVFCLNKKKGSKVLFLAPTKPLVNQHRKFFSSFFDSGVDELVSVNGSVAPAKRKEFYDKGVIIFSTPQTIENDLLNRRVDFSEFSLIIYDECHRAIGGYAYCFINNVLIRQNNGCKVLGLSASPGSDKDKILEVCNNLGLNDIVFFSDKDNDVKGYINNKTIEKIRVVLPNELVIIKSKLEVCLKKRLIILKDRGLINSSDLSKIKKSDFLKLQGSLQYKVRNNPNKDVFDSIIINSQVIKLLHSLEVLQTQGVKVLVEYFNDMKKKLNVKSNKLLFYDELFRDAVLSTFNIDGKVEHPKFEKLSELINNNFNNNSKFIVFTQLRTTGKRIVSFLKDKDSRFRPILFIGQQGKDGLNQKRQIEIIKKFEGGEFNILVATSVAEEGLHIPNVEFAVFFEPVPSGLRMIQRKGRVGRTGVGKIIILYTKDCIDEKYLYVSNAKERKMKYAIQDAINELKSKEQKGLGDYLC